MALLYNIDTTLASSQYNSFKCEENGLVFGVLAFIVTTRHPILVREWKKYELINWKCLKAATIHMIEKLQRFGEEFVACDHHFWVTLWLDSNLLRKISAAHLL